MQASIVTRDRAARGGGDVRLPESGVQGFADHRVNSKDDTVYSNAAMQYFSSMSIQDHDNVEEKAVYLLKLQQGWRRRFAH